MNVQREGFGLSGCAFGADGRFVALAERWVGGGAATVWEVESGQRVGVFDQHTNGVRDVAFSPDGQSVASASQDFHARIWDLSKRKAAIDLDHLAVRKADDPAVFSLAFSADGKQLATGCGDRRVRFWDARTGSLVRTLEGHGDSVSSVAFDRAGKFFASISRDGVGRLWRLDDFTEVLSFPTASNAPTSVAFNGASAELATLGVSRDVRVFPLETVDLRRAAARRTPPSLMSPRDGVRVLNMRAPQAARGGRNVNGE